MTVRVEVVTPCESCVGIGEWGPQYGDEPTRDCPACGGSGSSRRSFTEWPPEAIEAAAKVQIQSMLWNNSELGLHYVSWDEASDAQRDSARDGVQAALAAAWGQLTGDNK